MYIFVYIYMCVYTDRSTYVERDRLYETQKPCSNSHGPSALTSKAADSRPERKLPRHP